MYVYIIDHSPLGLFRANETTEMNLTGKESQLAGGRPVGYVQVQRRSRTRDYLEQIQVVVKAGLELGISRFQVPCPNHSAMLLSLFLPL